MSDRQLILFLAVLCLFRGQNANAQRTCFECDSVTNPDCVNEIGLKKAEFVNSAVCDNSEDSCLVVVVERWTVRGCASALDATCTADICYTCDSDNCNHIVFPENRRRCHKSQDTAGIARPETSEVCLEYVEGDSCYLSVDTDGIYTRGCFSDLTLAEQTDCTNNNDCKICTDDLCNQRQDFQSCHTCNSIDDANCVNLQGDITKKVCEDNLDECVSLINSGHTYRGCASEIPVPVPDPCDSTLCRKCDAENCNNAVFPPVRHQCHQCIGDAGSCMGNPAEDLSLRGICRVYANPDSCYTVISENNIIHRGCMSDSDTNLCDQSGDTCVKCFLNNCNSQIGRRAAELKCHKCDATDAACSWAHNLPEVCNNIVWFLDNEACYSIRRADGTADRGCMLDDEVTCRDGDLCEICDTDGCNGKSYNYHQCYQCNSAVAGEEACVNDVQEFEVKECRGDDQTQNDIGCYMLVRDDGNVVRGCRAQLDADLRDMCEKEENGCVSCNSDGCNDQPGAASALKIMPLMIFVTSWIAFKI